MAAQMPEYIKREAQADAGAPLLKVVCQVTHQKKERRVGCTREYTPNLKLHDVTCRDKEKEGVHPHSLSHRGLEKNTALC